MPTKNRVIVLGGTGYAGRNIASYLKNHEYDVLALGSKDIDFLDNGSAELFANKLTPECKVVITTAITRTKGDTVDTCLKNVSMIGNIVKGLMKTTPAKVIYLSGADVYGRPAADLKEDQAGNPKNPYGIYKLFAEQILTQAIPPSNLLILRLPGIFGGESDTTSIITRFTNKIRNNEEIFLSNAGKTQRDFISIPVLQRVMLKSFEDGIAGIYNLSCSPKLQMKTLASIIESILGQKAKLVLSHETSDRDFDQTLDCSALINKIGQIAYADIEKEIKSVVTR